MKSPKLTIPLSCYYDRIMNVLSVVPEMTCGFLIQLVFCKKKTMWFIDVEVEQETSAPPPKNS